MLKLNELGKHSSIIDGDIVLPFIKAIYYNIGTSLSRSLRNKMNIKSLKNVYTQTLEAEMVKNYFKNWTTIVNNRSSHIVSDGINEVAFNYFKNKFGKVVYDISLNKEKLNPTPRTLGQLIEILDLNEIKLVWKIPPKPVVVGNGYIK